MKYVYDTFTTPLGEFSIALDENGAVTATAFGGLAALKKRARDFHPTRDVSKLSEARKQVLAYFDGKLRKFTVPLAPVGTPFQQKVWDALLRIPFGKTLSYGEMAAQLGNAKASRAVGGANGANPVCLLIPCHRVIGADGSLTGFAFGENIKQRLLKHEGVPVKI